MQLPVPEAVNLEKEMDIYSPISFTTEFWMRDLPSVLKVGACTLVRMDRSMRQHLASCTPLFLKGSASGRLDGILHGLMQ